MTVPFGSIHTRPRHGRFAMLSTVANPKAGLDSRADLSDAFG